MEEVKKDQRVFYYENKYHPFLLNREEAAKFLGVDPKSFDKYIRPSIKLQRFMVGNQERFTKKWLMDYVEEKSF